MRHATLALLPALVLAGCLTPEMQQERERARFAAEGHKYLQRGSHREARASFRLALELRPDDADTLFQLARCAAALNEKQESEGLLMRCLALDPGHEGARSELVRRMLADGRPDDARRMVNAWLANQPGKPGPYVEDGLLRLRDGDIDAARGRFEQAIDFDPTHPRANLELGKVYERLDHPGRALQLYEMAAQLGDAEGATRLASLRKKGTPRPRPD